MLEAGGGGGLRVRAISSVDSVSVEFVCQATAGVRGSAPAEEWAAATAAGLADAFVLVTARRLAARQGGTLRVEEGEAGVVAEMVLRLDLPAWRTPSGGER